MEKFEQIKHLTFGDAVAEDENELRRYFVETAEWKQVLSGEADIILGPKGSGKSAIYSMIPNHKELIEHRIIPIQAENPTGKTAFAGLHSSTDITEGDLKEMWKIYFLTLIVKELDAKYPGDYFKETKKSLSAHGIIFSDRSSILQSIIGAIGKVKLAITEPNTGIVFSAESNAFKPNSKFSTAISIDDLWDSLEAELTKYNLTIWLLLDRLDSAFAGLPGLETSVLRALFRVYLDIRHITHVSLKIFLRDDIWDTIVDGGFVEASHITKEVHLHWGRQELLQLITRRIEESAWYKMQHKGITSSAKSTADQEALFYSIFPRQVDSGTRRPSTFDWVLSRTKDGKGINAPRELIQFFSFVQKRQMHHIEKGADQIPKNSLFEPQAFKDAWSSVSETRLKKTIFAEYPKLRQFITELKGQKATQNLTSLASIWKLDAKQTKDTADDLVAIGFLEVGSAHGKQTLRVPFLYWPALGIIQGKAVLLD